jgi:hypothetical protein
MPSTIRADVTMDFIEGFPYVNEKMIVLTIIDQFSMRTSSHWGTLTPPPQLAAFFNNIVQLHGIPSSIMSDREPVLTNHF